jgi:hemerythrin-like domain-containing protein
MRETIVKINDEKGGDMKPDRGRRTLLSASGVWGAGLLLSAAALPGCREEKRDQQEERTTEKGIKENETEVTPAEDLMREHGVLKRILLVYRHYIERIDARQELPAEPLGRSARIIRSFVEDYHERLEENYLFPRFRKANRLVDLVDALVAQHQAGRRLTEKVLQLSTAQGLADGANRQEMRTWLAQFVRMYEPHEAREDTVLFPAFATIVSADEYASLGEQFEEEEHKLFGEDGFERMVDEVASIEKALGIYELAQFTPDI